MGAKGNGGDNYQCWKDNWELTWWKGMTKVELGPKAKAGVVTNIEGTTGD